MAGIFKSLFGSSNKDNAVDKKVGSSIDNKYEIAEIYKEFRNNVLTLKPTEVGLSPSGSNPVWAVLMETGNSDYVATLVAIADGTLSFYLSSGVTIIGAGNYEEPRKACSAFLSLAPDYIQYAKPTEEFPLPAKKHTRFYFLTYDGILTVEYKEKDLSKKNVPLSPFFIEAHKLIARIRVVEETVRARFQDLMHAISNGDVSKVKKFITEGTALNRSDETGLTPLMAAVYSGKDEIVKILLEQDCQLEAKDEYGYTPLMFASNNGQVECARLLIEKGADVNARDNESATPIMFAAQHGYNELARLLLENGADPEIKCDHDLSAIGFAEQNGHSNTLEILKGH